MKNAKKRGGDGRPSLPLGWFAFNKCQEGLWGGGVVKDLTKGMEAPNRGSHRLLPLLIGGAGGGKRTIGERKVAQNL